MRRTRSLLALGFIVALLLGALTTVGAALQSPAAASKAKATVETDQEDYPPDTQVNVTGSGWLPREVVELTFTEIATNPPGGYTDGPFVFYATSDAKGNIANGDFYTDEHDIGVTFKLAAKGVLSGRTAETFFTDGIATLSQCANDQAPSPSTDGCNSNANQWVSGNLGASKSTYNEGDSIPYRLGMTGLATGSGTHTVTIEWDTTKSDKHAIDYLTTFNRTVANANPCLGVSGCGSPTTFAIPGDPQVTGAGVTPAAGNFTLYGGTITGVSAYSYADGSGFVGDKTARITISFMASVANPVLAWGGHIATRLDWGAGASAVAISGSPYHMRLIDVDGTGGNQDRSLSADAVVFPGSITIFKDAVPNDAQDFGFTTTGGLTPTTFSLDDDADPTLSNKQEYKNLTNFATYTFAETAVQGWTVSFNSPVCTVTSANGGSQSASSNTLTISLKEGENVSCTFVNTRQAAHIIVTKHVINDNGGTADASAWTLQANGTDGQHSGTGNPATGTDASIDFVVQPGTYTVSEAAGGPAGYTNTTTDANNGDCNASNSVTVTAGQTKNCTITNDDQAASLTIIKRIVNDSGGSKVATDFGITAGGSSLSFGSGQQDGANTLKYTATTLTGLSAGTKALHENAVAGYSAGTGWSCVGGGTVVSDAQSGSVVLANGDAATCTITNDDQAASLTIIKRITNDNGGTKVATDFGITAAGSSLSFGSGVQDGANTLKYTATALSLGAGTKALHENAVSGYSAGTGWSCVGGGTVVADPQSGSIVLANGDSATCTITNDDQPASLTIIKRVVNDNGGAKVATDFGITAAGSSLSFGGGSSDGASTLKYTATTLTGLSAGTKALHEEAVVGYSAGTGWSCVGGGTVVANAQAGSVVLANGDAATCTITNDDQAASLTIIKRIVNDNGGAKVPSDFSITAAGSSLTFDGGTADGTSTLKYTATTLTGLSAGTKALHEAAVSGYSAGSGWSCVGGGTVTADPQTGSVVLANGDSATCTITNDDQPASLTIIKRIVNDNGGTKVVADFAITAANTALSFDGGIADGTSTLKYTATALTGLSAGVTPLHETLLTGYTSSLGWQCSGGAGAVVSTPAAGSVDLKNGETVTCTITNDDAKASPTGTTVQGATLFDQINLTGWLSGGGVNTVTFSLYSNAACTALVGSSGGTLNAAGQASTANGITVSGSGTYYWKVEYAGDSFNTGFTSTCGGANDEKTVVTMTGS